MTPLARTSFALLVALSFASPLVAQNDKQHALIAFDENGKLDDAKAWARLKKDLADRNPKNVFLIAHGWRTSKLHADATFSFFGKDLRAQQGNDGPIEVIGIRWPSLLGDNDTAQDEAFKNLARAIAASIADSKKLDERRDKLKVFLKKRTTRFLANNLLKLQLPEDERLDEMLDNIDEPENVERLLTTFTYYQMKNRAGVVGATGLTTCINELQAALPKSRIHLVGHSFGCKVMLSCLASEGRADKQVDSATLLQGAVSCHCFAEKIDELKDVAGAYLHTPKRVKGSVAITFTKNDKALSIAYLAASQSAGQIAELPMRKYQVGGGLYYALGAKGVGGVAGITPIEMGEKGTMYKLRPGLNAIDADKIIMDHGDIRKDAVSWLIWSAARTLP
jgi:predicted alpha/beta hydrolase family esterase